MVMGLIQKLISLVSSLGGFILTPIRKLSAFKITFKVPYKELNKKITLIKKRIKILKKTLRRLYKKGHVFLRTLSKFSNKKIKKKTKTKKRKRKRKGKTKEKVVLLPSLNRFLNFPGFKPFLFGIGFSLIFILIPLVGYVWFQQLPSPQLLSQITNKSTKILDRKGRLLYDIYLEKKYEPVDLSEIPDDVIKATLAIEDSSFYRHSGIRLSSIIRAAKVNLLNDELQGGSTITQQLVKNVLLTPERTVSRKVKEIVISLMVEKRYTKEEILELYLNNISYGGTAWGIQSASHKFFGKDVWELDLAEAAFLAGLPSAPSAYSPFLTSPDVSKARQKVVLDRMQDLGYITKEEAGDAFEKDLILVSQAEYIRAPHFVAYIRKQLEETYGSRYVTLGGLTVMTTLDLDLQEQVQDIVTQEVANNSFYGFSNGAAVVLDVQTREIIAYVGSKDYFADDIDGKFDIATAYRQPGSSIKPVTYSLAFQNKLTPATIIDDSPLSINTIQGVYSPRNYDGKYHGNVSLRRALANSYNIPAVKLAQRLGPDNIVDLGNKLGLSNWEVDGSYGVSITLGGKEVRLLDHTNVFSTFGAHGRYKNETGILAVKDANGFEIHNDTRRENRVLSEGISYLISNILSDNNARAPAFGYNSALVVPNHPVAVKTGTTDSIRDNWTMGYTPKYAVGVWVGNNDNTPMHPNLSSGLTGAAPIWNKIMRTLLDGTQPLPFEKPKSVFTKTDKKCNASEIFVKGSYIPADLCPEVEEDDDDDEKEKD
jgi:1A family penicillin-binding protein